MQFYELKIKDKQMLTPQAAALHFDVPQELQDQFTFNAGQYLTVEASLNGEAVRRSYSICSSSLSNKLKIGVKKVEGGLFSSYAVDELSIGDTMRVMAPDGRFIAKNGYEDQNLLFVAAGSGITPILSHVETALRASKSVRCTLLYCNKNPHTAMFRSDLEYLKNEFLERLNIVYIYSESAQEVELFSGRITGDKCATILRNWVQRTDFDHTFLCGPEAMITEVRTALEGLGMPAGTIHYELFNTGAVSRPNRKKASTKNEPQRQATVILDGVAHQIVMQGDERVLDAARRNNIDAPFSCQGGICSTCRCKILEGSGEMEINHALEDYEVEQGFALSCQLVPSSKSITISYDEGH